MTILDGDSTVECSVSQVWQRRFCGCLKYSIYDAYTVHVHVYTCVLTFIHVMCNIHHAGGT